MVQQSPLSSMKEAFVLKLISQRHTTCQNCQLYSPFNINFIYQ